MNSGIPQADQPIVNIVGEKVALGPLRRDLMDLDDRWFNDFEVGLPYFLRLRPHTREAREAWYDRLAKDEPDTTDFLGATSTPASTTKRGLYTYPVNQKGDRAVATQSGDNPACC
jgi:hypothetical protein